MRTDLWLRQELNSLLQGAFRDLEIQNRLEVRFGRKASRRFGSIAMNRNQQVSRITINGYFKDESIPVAVVQATLAHELSHYAHGFSSPLPKKYGSPHAGGVILREFRKRGLEALHHYEKNWTKAHWPDYLKRKMETAKGDRWLARRPLKRRPPSLLRFLLPQYRE